MLAKDLAREAQADARAFGFGRVERYENLFQLFGFEATVENTTVTTGAVLEIRDGGAGGTLLKQFLVAAGTNQTTGAIAIAKSLVEPIPFDTDVYAVLANLTVPGATIAVNIEGYEEDL